ncbi:MAG: PQQ-like beta-propeller repeat protein [Planctomycetales bacterium]|nr:PQQ-like beta-propeller repeat protein [Planctomycetales bacterium]
MFLNNRDLLISLYLAVTVCGCSRVDPVEEIRSLPAATKAETALEVDLQTDWPWWRGPNQDGHSLSSELPTSWSADENVVWSVAVPGRGHSSPCVVSNRLFLTTADEVAHRQIILCYDQGTGQQLWAAPAHEGKFMQQHSKNSQASATPACDGKHVFALFLNAGGLWATATDLTGQILWQTEAGPFGSEHGYGSSPTIYKSLLIVLGDNLTGSFIAALDRQTGRIVWRITRPTTGQHGSFATPVIANIAGRDQLLVTGMKKTSSYDPTSGKLLWSCDGPSEVTANTVAWGDGLVFASGGYPEKQLLAIRADGSGNITHSHIAWEARKGTAYVPSPVFHGGKLFVISDDGIATCFDAANGRMLHKVRIGGNFSASPILANGFLYVVDEQGTTVVIRAEESLEIVARNELGNGGMASLTICNSRIYVRASDRLYCIAHQPD